MRYLLPITQSACLVGVLLSVGVAQAVVASPCTSSEFRASESWVSASESPVFLSEAQQGYEPPVEGGPDNTQGSGTR